MVSIYDLKPAFQAGLRPLVGILAQAGGTPNAVTLTALALSIAAGVAIAAHPASRWPLAVLPLVLFVRMALNALDGMMARTLGLPSKIYAVVSGALRDAPLPFSSSAFRRACRA